MSVPAGIIVLWSGSVGSIPTGWVLCDGNNDTPDLRNRFVVGAGDVYAVDATGGTTGHLHTFTTDGHDHIFNAGTQITSGFDTGGTTNVKTDTGTTDASANVPPYYALAYIMKT